MNKPKHSISLEITVKFIHFTTETTYLKQVSFDVQREQRGTMLNEAWLQN